MQAFGSSQTLIAKLTAVSCIAWLGRLLSHAFVRPSSAAICRYHFCVGDLHDPLDHRNRVLVELCLELISSELPCPQRLVPGLRIQGKSTVGVKHSNVSWAFPLADDASGEIRAARLRVRDASLCQCHGCDIDEELHGLTRHKISCGEPTAHRPQHTRTTADTGTVNDKLARRQLHRLVRCFGVSERATRIDVSAAHCATRTTPRVNCQSRRLAPRPRARSRRLRAPTHPRSSRHCGSPYQNATAAADNCAITPSRQ
jgi:hypothetical protein